MYVTLKMDDSGCRNHNISDDDENKEIVTNERYMVMPWKMVARYSKNMTLKEAVEEIEKQREERKLVSKFEAKHRDEILEILGLIDYIDIGYVEEKFPEIYKFGPEQLGIHFKDKLVLEEYSSSYPINRGYSKLDYFKKTFGAYQGLDKCAFKYVKKVKELIDKPLEEMGLGSNPGPCRPIKLEDVRLAMKKVNCPRKLDISVFYRLTKRLLHEGGVAPRPRARKAHLNYDDERLLIHFYNTFMVASIKLLGKHVRYRTNVLYHLLKKIDKEPNTDLFHFMKGDSHQQTEEEIKFVLEHLGWSYSLLPA